MAQAQQQGTCLLCENEFSKRAMANHLKSCREKQAAVGPGRLRDVFQLVVEATGMPEYWLHVEAADSAQLRDLDSLLRETWLECCGHLSLFHIGKQVFSASEFEDGDMSVPLGRVLEVGLKFAHEYDFGSTTYLTLRVISKRQAKWPPNGIQLQARNDPLDILCDVCGQPATQVCTECCGEDEGCFCDSCLQKHSCGDEMALPVANSPRMGVCGYTG